MGREEGDRATPEVGEEHVEEARDLGSGVAMKRADALRKEVTIRARREKGTSIDGKGEFGTWTSLRRWGRRCPSWTPLIPACTERQRSRPLQFRTDDRSPRPLPHRGGRGVPLARWNGEPVAVAVVEIVNLGVQSRRCSRSSEIVE